MTRRQPPRTGSLVQARALLRGPKPSRTAQPSTAQPIRVGVGGDPAAAPAPTPANPCPRPTLTPFTPALPPSTCLLFSRSSYSPLTRPCPSPGSFPSPWSHLLPTPQPLCSQRPQTLPLPAPAPAFPFVPPPSVPIRPISPAPRTATPRGRRGSLEASSFVSAPRPPSAAPLAPHSPPQPRRGRGEPALLPEPGAEAEARRSPGRLFILSLLTRALLQLPSPPPPLPGTGEAGTLCALALPRLPTESPVRDGPPLVPSDQPLQCSQAAELPAVPRRLSSPEPCRELLAPGAQVGTPGQVMDSGSGRWPPVPAPPPFEPIFRISAPENSAHLPA